MKKMNVLFTFLSALVILTASAGRSSAVNLLLNGNLDNTLHVGGGASGQTPDNWQLDEFKTNSGSTTDLIDLEGFAGSVGANTNPGDLGGFVKAFQGGNQALGDFANLNMYQDVVGVPGVKYLFSGYIGAGSNYSGLVAGSPTQTLLTIEFDNDNNRGNGVLSSVVTNVGPSLTPGSSLPGWNAQLYSATGTAPAGTTVVRGVFSALKMFTGPNPDPSAFIDDFNLSPVPEPTSIALGMLGLAGMFGAARRRS